uniref:Uncharacterized protein n=1 Tax=Arundo donax TaxID=35708 RepID=A0A0A9EP78_ARUDO
MLSVPSPLEISRRLFIDVVCTFPSLGCSN